MPGNKVDMSKLPNQGLKNLAKERPDVVKRMGFEHGGLVKAERCPHREAPVDTPHTPASITGIKGGGAAIKGVGFKGVF